MAETKLNESAQQLAKAVRQSNETLVNGALAAQERTIRYAQGVLETGIETARRHTESAAALRETLTKQAQNPQAAWQAWMDSAVAAQERNIQFAQRMLEQGTAFLKSQAESAQALTQTLFEQSQQGQDAFRAFTQESLNASLNSFFAATR